MTPFRQSAVLVLLVTLVAGVGLPVAAQSSEEPDTPMLLGLVSSDPFGELADFTAEAGRGFAIHQTFWSLDDTWPKSSAEDRLRGMDALGVVVYVEITTVDIDALINGGKDEVLDALVASVAPYLRANDGVGMLVAPLPESNLDEHAWSAGPDAYKAGYLRIRQAFLNAGLDGSDVRFVFAMNGLSSYPYSYSDFYPGDDVVDLVGFSKLNRNSTDGWRDYDVVFAEHIAQMQTQVSRSKPIVITQTGTVDDGAGGKDRWLDDMMRLLPNEDQVIGAIYFNRVKQESGAVNDFRILIDGRLNDSFEAGFSAWSDNSETAWLFNGQMDEWVAWREANVTGPTFDDTDGHVFADEIEWLADQGITSGCAASSFCPDAEVTRAQMATFLDRALGFAGTSVDYFSDDDGMVHEERINRLAAAGVTLGCEPGLYCPHDSISRAQMASFLVRALDLPATSTDYFDDDDGSTHESNINRLAQAGVTLGCGPRSFCVDEKVTRAQMAAFLFRALTG